MRYAAGHFADELAQIVGVDTQDALLRLVPTARLERTRFDGRYLYCSPDDEQRQRRLFAGFESLRLGHGGDRRVAESFGMSAKTVAKGRQQQLRGEVGPASIRKPGGERKSKSGASST